MYSALLKPDLSATVATDKFVRRSKSIAQSTLTRRISDAGDRPSKF
jgi:hypothetical protein